jgi:hypothetical protein
MILLQNNSFLFHSNFISWKNILFPLFDFLFPGAKSDVFVGPKPVISWTSELNELLDRLVQKYFES